MKTKALSLTMAALLLLFSGALLTACGGGGMEGTAWVLSGGSIGGVTVTSDQLKDLVGEMRFEFKSGGKVILSAEKAGTDEGTYTADDSAVTVTDSTGMTQTFQKDGDTMTLTQDYGGQSATLVFTKS